MPFQLKDVVPWGRNFEEYCTMFDLARDDLEKRILGCADGPASFNAELSRRGGKVISIDPLYSFNKDDIQKRIDETFNVVIEQTTRNLDSFVWQHIRSVEHLSEVRRQAMDAFLEDFSIGKTQERYVVGSLPKLPFSDKAFELALCSHFLFLYSEQFSYVFHLESILELCRVASEVRIFPLHTLANQRSSYLGKVINVLEEKSYDVAIKEVPYEFQKGARHMLCVKEN
jgi:hypothetical protein